eukprot:GHVR01165126.1.p1 GENE.GHVR01165126.1~~GHVR01165126.1.p1  ORF type:complete len:139 (-),score=13.93 GHVR01165126.1:87-503(-)
MIPIGPHLRESPPYLLTPYRHPLIGSNNNYNRQLGDAIYIQSPFYSSYPLYIDRGTTHDTENEQHTITEGSPYRFYRTPMFNQYNDYFINVETVRPRKVNGPKKSDAHRKEILEGHRKENSSRCQKRKDKTQKKIKNE